MRGGEQWINELEQLTNITDENTEKINMK